MSKAQFDCPSWRLLLSVEGTTSLGAVAETTETRASGIYGMGLAGCASPDYAREELRAEISSMMTGDQLQLGHDPSLPRGQAPRQPLAASGGICNPPQGG